MCISISLLPIYPSSTHTSLSSRSSFLFVRFNCVYVEAEINVGCPLQLFFSLFSEPEAHMYDETGLPASFDDSLVSTFPELRLQLCTKTPGF